MLHVVSLGFIVLPELVKHILVARFIRRNVEVWHDVKLVPDVFSFLYVDHLIHV